MLYLLDASAHFSWLLLQVFVGLLIADFLSGLFHWMEDRYGSPRWPIVGRIISSTVRHHARPMRILKSHPLLRSAPVLVLVALGALLLSIPSWLNVVTLTALGVVAFANEIHAAAHANPKDLLPIVRHCQRIGLLQSHAHHAAHHRGLKNTHYCTITNWLNPALERVRFWRRIEALIRVTARQRPRPDPTVRRRQRRLNRRSRELVTARGLS